MKCSIDASHNISPSHTLVLSSTSSPLTKNIGVPLYDREVVVFEDFVIQITVAIIEKGSTKHSNDSANANCKKFHEQDVSYKMWKLNDIDGDKTVITILLESTVYNLGTNIKVGAAIHINSAFPAYFNYHDMTNMQCAVVIHDFSIIGRMPVPPNFVGPPTE